MSAIDIRAIQTKELVVEPFPKVDQSFRVVVAESALDRCVERGSADMSREIGGVLVGVVLKDDAGPYLRVEDTVDALHAEEKGAELTFTHETWDHINSEMDTKHAGKTIVGWYHTHPGFGIFLSDRDEFIHKSFFDLPFQVALVYDPKSREHGVFAWANGSLARMTRYWIGRREHTWTAPQSDRPAAPTEVVPGAMTASETDELQDYGRVDWAAMAMIGVMVLLVGGFGGWWLGSMASAQKEGEIRSLLLEAKVAGAQDAVKMLDMRVMGAVRTGFETQLGDEALRLIETHLTAARKAALSATAPATPPETTPSAPVIALVPPDASGVSSSETVAQIDRALAVTKTLAKDRRHMSAALAQLERTAESSRVDKLESKQLSLQRAALATLFADLSIDAKKNGDDKRARRYLQLARTVDPDSAKRYDKQTGKQKPKELPGVKR